MRNGGRMMAIASVSYRPKETFVFSFFLQLTTASRDIAAQPLHRVAATRRHQRADYLSNDVPM